MAENPKLSYILKNKNIMKTKLRKFKKPKGFNCVFVDARGNETPVENLGIDFQKNRITVIADITPFFKPKNKKNVKKST